MTCLPVRLDRQMREPARDGDLADLGIFFAQFAVRIFANMLLLIGVLVALYIEDWRIGLALTIYSLISLIALNRMIVTVSSSVTSRL